MSISVSCGDCGRAYRVSDSLAGRTFRCKSCGAAVAVRSGDKRPIEETDFSSDEFEDIPAPPPPPRKTVSRKTSKKGKKSEPALTVPARVALGLIGGGLGVAILIGVLNGHGSSNRPIFGPAPFATVNAPPPPPPVAVGPGPVAVAAAVPQSQFRAFPELGPAGAIGGSPVGLHRVDFASVPQTPGAPASTMKLRVYLPAGELAPQSIPMVLIAPAGTPMMYGNDVELDSDYHKETLPYAEAGMCVVNYSLDGPLNTDNPTGYQFRAAHQQFEAAQAGVLNARNALEFALARIPAVDPRRIYSAGHSSAATLSLLVAAHEPRVAGCIAYAPCTDVALHCQEALQDPVIRRAVPNLEAFLVRSSPKTHVAAIRCPTFLFYANDDSITPLARNRPFIQELQAKNPQTTFVDVPVGNHYDSMIDEGIPRAIAWLTEKAPALPAPPEAPASIPPSAPATTTAPTPAAPAGF